MDEEEEEEEEEEGDKVRESVVEGGEGEGVEDDDERAGEGEEEEEEEGGVSERGIPGLFRNDETMESSSFPFWVKLLNVCRMRLVSTKSITVSLSMFDE